MVAGGYQHKPELPFVPGMEGAGTIHALGDGVTNWKPGDRVIFSAGENYQIGFVDICDTPYPETIAASRRPRAKNTSATTDSVANSSFLISVVALSLAVAP